MIDVLIKNVVLDGIVSGDIDTLFRRQRRPTVRAGGTLRTRIGMLDILTVEAVDAGDITVEDARRAGFASVDELTAELASKPDGTLYRVRVRKGGEDPRITLRNDDNLSDDDVAALVAKLDAMDGRSPEPWTRTTMRLIAEQPHTRAPDLAASIGWETKPFKANVAKLKGLGLTISHSPGYELSPRGLALYDRL